MPVHRGHDYYGWYYQWGSHGHKYYYTPDRLSKDKARAQAIKQGRAAHARGYRE